MYSAEELSSILRSNGCKVTPQRLVVYDMLAHTTEHPTAKMIYETIRQQYPTMSFATVYKSVEIFRRLGVIQVLNTGEDSYRYDANITEHPHIRCTKCDRVCDVSHLEADAVERMVAEETGFDVRGHQFYFYGICPDCQKKLKEKQKRR
jgi:Fur family peroxide stress response transcriptional regulator